MATTTDTKPSLTLIVSFPYRGQPEEWSQTYHFDGGTPADATHWKALADAVAASLKPCIDSTSTIVRAYGHEAGNSLAVWSYDYFAHSAAITGTLSPLSSSHVASGDVAAWLRWSTANFTSTGKRIYLRNYFHGCYSTGGDNLDANQKAAMQTFGAAWVTGFSDGTNTCTRCGPRGAAGSSPVASTYLTTRTLERRGKRP